MKNILILGAGRSASTLIRYMLDESITKDWFITVGDINIDLCKQKINGHERAKAIRFDVFDTNQCHQEVQKVDLVISMLPARFHITVAKACVQLQKSMLTASYVSDEIKALDDAAKKSGILLLNEIGLDPGIDHLSAKKIIDDLHQQGAEITAFKSFTGGLIAPESDNNPWHYKFTWNPRNVVLAGQGTAKFIHNGRYKYVPYHQLFSHLERLDFDGLGEFEGYPNRDSLKYCEVYNLKNIPTMLRGTIRYKGFSNAWDTFVQLGMTDDSYVLHGIENATYRDFLNAFLKYSLTDSVEEKLAKFLGESLDSDIMKALSWLGIFENKKINLPNATPAQVLQQLLEEKWQLEPEDKDMIVMQHHFKYQLNDNAYHLKSSMVVFGEDTQHTAMSKTVGLPLAIAAKLVLENKIQLSGVQIPTSPSIYKVVLSELESLGIRFTEKTTPIDRAALYE